MHDESRMIFKGGSLVVHKTFVVIGTIVLFDTLACGDVL